jgi:hypothetical protein
LYEPLRYTGGVEVELHPFLTLILDAGKWSASYPTLPLREELLALNE